MQDKEGVNVFGSITMSRCWLWGQSLYVSTAGKYSKSSRVRCHHYVVVCCPISIHPLGRGHRASWKGEEECSLYSKPGKIPRIVLENFFHTYKPLYNLNNLQCVGHWFVTNPPSVPQLSIFGVTPPPLPQHHIRDALTCICVPLCLFLPHFAIICGLLLNSHTATWNLFECESFENIGY